MAKQNEYVRYTIRVPEPLYKQLQEAAGEKSINAEVVERLAASFQSKSPALTIQVEALPEGEPAVKVSLLQFLNSFSHALRVNIDMAKASEAEEKRSADKTLLPPDHDYES